MLTRRKLNCNVSETNIVTAEQVTMLTVHVLIEGRDILLDIFQK